MLIYGCNVHGKNQRSTLIRNQENRNLSSAFSIKPCNLSKRIEYIILNLVKSNIFLDHHAIIAASSCRRDYYGLAVCAQQVYVPGLRNPCVSDL